MNKPKKQGTSFESSLVNKLIAEGYSDAKRLAEGGSNDIGDIESVSYTHLTLPTNREV